MIVLGLGFNDHETSAALVIDGELCTAIARERLTRIKRDGKVWGSHRLDLTPAIQYCLEEHNLTIDDVDLIVWCHIDHLSSAEVYDLLASEGGMNLSSRPLIALSHHFAHACCTFYVSPFDEAAVLVADGGGGPLDKLIRNCVSPETETLASGSTIVQDLDLEPTNNAREQESFYHFDGEWKTLRKTFGLYSGIGAEYGTASELLFGDCLDAGKTMGLAPYGRPYTEPMFFEMAGTAELPVFRSLKSTVKDALKEEIRRWRERQDHANLNYEVALLADYAAGVQDETEKALLHYARWLRQHSGAKKLCLAGGVALNCVANSLLAQQSGFEEIFVPPAPGDDGIAVGCALYGAALNNELKRAVHRPFLGRTYRHDPTDLAFLGLLKLESEGDLFETIAREIAGGAVVGWYQGGAELGPRALGHRSFLADPRRPEMKDYINNQIKHREPFRPFAPVILDEAVSDYFIESFPSYFMSFIARVRPEKLALLPAVAHVDATARYQVLQEHHNPQLYQLVTAFARLTGVPLLLNTSFNRAGEPLVETPLDAARCVIASAAHYLVIDGNIYQPQTGALDNPRRTKSLLLDHKQFDL
jgi:carbamoyltransferase